MICMNSPLCLGEEDRNRSRNPHPRQTSVWFTECNIYREDDSACTSKSTSPGSIDRWWMMLQEGVFLLHSHNGVSHRLGLNSSKHGRLQNQDAVSECPVTSHKNFFSVCCLSYSCYIYIILLPVLSRETSFAALLARTPLWRRYWISVGTFPG